MLLSKLKNVDLGKKILKVYNDIEQAGIFHWPIYATSISFYCILGMVPFLALCFAIAKSFGLEAALNEAILSYFATFEGQNEVLAYIRGFAENLISNYSGSIMAFVAIGLIFWSMYVILTLMEIAFGSIFGYHPTRHLLHRLLDYFTVMVVVPMALVAGAAVNIYMTGLSNATWSLPGGINPSDLFSIFVVISPYLMWWLLLSWAYAYFSRGLISWPARILGGLATGICFQLFQTLYIKIMFALTSYNAIYASFAGIPLFMIWLYISWIIVFAGGELSRRISDLLTFGSNFFSIPPPATWQNTTELCHQVMAEIITNYTAEPVGKGTTFGQLSLVLKVPMPTLGMVINRLLATNLLVRISQSNAEASNGPCFMPAHSPTQLTDEYINQTLGNGFLQLY